jgi:hypothetical protein
LPQGVYAAPFEKIGNSTYVLRTPAKSQLRGACYDRFLRGVFYTNRWEH